MNAAATAHHFAVMRDEETQASEGIDNSPGDSPPPTKPGAEELVANGERVERARAEAVNGAEETETIVAAMEEHVEEADAEEEEEQEETTKFVEWDPTGRFGRTTELLGRGTYKNVFKAFDEEEGMDVAWNQVKVHGLPAAEKQRLLSEVEILKRLDHKNVLKFYHSWNATSEKTGEVSVNFITEACAGTLNKYAARFKNNLDMRAVKSWARQILRGLDYLHSHEPPIVHRDLKCDNIFVNGNAGEIKIGDLGLAAMLDHQRTHSVIGTPEFMAPELYEEDYDERVDIYSFGMCLIELVTFECPYNECKNPAQIYKRVSSGIPPAALEKIKEKGDKIYEFITLAIAPHDQRPTAKDLLAHPWLDKTQAKKSMVPRAVVEEEPEVPRPAQLDDDEEEALRPTQGQEHPENGRKIVRVYSEADTLEPPTHKRGASLDVRVKGLFLEDDSLRLRLRIADASGHNRTVEFPFNTDTDSAHSVAAEMVQELGLETTAIITIEREIEKEVKYLWDEKRGFCEIDPTSRRHSAESSGGSSPEGKVVRNGEDTVKLASTLLSSAVSSETLVRAPSNESLGEGAKLRAAALDDSIISTSTTPFVDAHQREQIITRSQSAFGAIKQEGVTAYSGGSTPGDQSPPQVLHRATGSPARPMSVPPSVVAAASTVEQADIGKPPRAPIANAQPNYSEALMQDVQRIIDDGSVADTITSSAASSDAGSYAHEEEHEELEELRLLEELELQQQQEEAEMRQRHTTERQQKLRSLQKKRLERTASKMALLQSGSDSESAARTVHAPAAPTTKPATRLSAGISASNLNPGLPPHPLTAQTAAPLPPAPLQQQQQQPQQPQQFAVEQFATQGPVETHVMPVASQVSQLQTEDLTMSRTSSQRSLGSAGSDSKFCDDGPDLPIEEQQKMAKEKKRIEALAKMQMMEQTSLLSLDSKPKERKGSMMSLCSQSKKADSSDESEVQ